MSDDFEFFYGGPFSQWFKCNLLIDGVTYNCAEQYMMAMKALTFGDTEAHAKIMSSRDPSVQKAWGRKVKNFDYSKWSDISRRVVYKANMVKFSNPILKDYLLATENKEIVEASPYDTIWGIGLAENDPNILDKSKWRGTNWLGIVLMQVRSDLRSDQPWFHGGCV